MPLQPRLREACRLCQLMHVLSFGEGRKLSVVLFSMARSESARIKNATLPSPSQTMDTFRGFCHANVEYARDIDVKLVNL